MGKYINEFPQHFDINGNPLASYVVYFGLPNQDPKTNPKVPYSDRALTNPISATQTLNDQGAYGSDIFLNGAYSIRIETPTGSLWRESPQISGLFDAQTFNAFTVPAMIADATLIVGDFVTTVGYNSAGDYGDNVYEIVAAGTGTADAGSFIDLTGSGLQAKALFPRGNMNVKQWGVQGDGTDEYTPFQAAVSWAESTTKKINLLDLTIRTDTTISGTEGLTIEDGTFDFSQAVPGSAAPGPDEPNTHAFDARGSIDTARNLTADSNKNDRTINVSVADSANFSVDQWAYITAETVWGLTNDKVGEIVRIAAIDGGTGEMTLYWPIVDTYVTADNATIAPLTMVEDIHFKNVDFIGGGVGKADQAAIALFFANNCTIENCKADQFGGRQFSLITSINVEISGKCEVTNGDSDNYAAYGVGLLNCCQWITVRDCYFQNLRHAVSPDQQTSFGGICRWLKILNNDMFGSRDAGFDAHTPVQYMSIKGNHIQVDYDEAETNPSNGILVQGKNIQIQDNIIDGDINWGIYYQSQVDDYTGSQINSSIIDGNTVNAESGDRAIFVRTSNPAGGGDQAIKGFNITNNILNGNYVRKIYVFAEEADIEKLNISHNTGGAISSSRAIHLDVFTGRTIRHVKIIGNDTEMTNNAVGLYNVYIDASTGTIEDVNVGHNTLLNGEDGVRGTSGNDNHIFVRNNYITATNPTNLTAASQSVGGNLP